MVIDGNEHGMIITSLYCRSPLLYAMVNSSIELCEKLFQKLTSTSEAHIGLVKTAISCSLFAIQQIYQQKLSHTEVGKNEKRKAIEALSKAVSGWIANPKVIGGSIFGYSIPMYEKGGAPRARWKGRQELEVRILPVSKINDSQTHL